MAFVRRLAVSVVGISISVTALSLSPANAASGVGNAHGASGAGSRPAVAPQIGGQGFTAVAPTRLLDTRTDPIIHTLGPAGTADITVTGVAAVPATGVEAVVLNVTAIASASTYLTAYPAGSTRPTASNLNVAAGATRANQVIAEVGTNGQVTVYNNAGNTNLLVDISGYLLTSSTYTGQAPARILDTRTTGGPLAAKETRAVQVTGVGGVPSGVTSVVLNLTAVPKAQGGYVTAYPFGTTRPTTSNINLAASQTAAVLVVAKLGTGGKLDLYSSGGPTNLILDVAGWFTGATDYTALTPSRLLDSRTASSGPVSGADFTLQVTGHGGVPTSAGAVVLSVTAIKPSKNGYLTLHAAGTKIPATSNVSVADGATTANLVVAQLSSTGAIGIYDKAQDAGVLVDVEGYLSTNAALAFPNPNVTPGEVTQAYSLGLIRSAGLAPYSWDITTGTLPTGLSLNTTTGAITGTPTVDGTVSATVRVQDSSGGSATQVVKIQVYPFVSKASWGWGVSGSGVFGTTDTKAQTFTPAQLPDLSPYTKLAIGGNTAYGIKSDGTVWAWGKGTGGQLGNGTNTATTSTPVQVTGLAGAVDVISGGRGTAGYALLGDGTVWAWGANTSGQLGNGGTAASNVPVQVGGTTPLTGITAIGSGPTATYAVKSNGTAFAWGAGGAGQLGDNSKNNSSSPVQIAGLTNVTQVAGAYQVGYALKSDGTVWAFGSGSAGQLGNGTLNSTTTPVQVSGLTDATSISAGYYSAYAVRAGGGVVAWGSGSHGTLGNSSTANSDVPVAVSGLTHITQVAGGMNIGYALDNTGKVWAWGLNTGGALGAGNFVLATTIASTPVQVLLPQVNSIAANHSAQSALAIGPN